MESEYLGTIVRLQIQRSGLKVEGPERKRFDPAPLLAVVQIDLTPDGVTIENGEGATMLDVHHRGHPMSKNHGGLNAVSIGFTSHYATMRGRFGDRVTDGIAGENILVETDRIIDEGEVAAGVIIEAAEGGRVPLTDLMVAEPCVEFTRFAMRFPPDSPSDRSVSEALLFLRGGIRGFYARYEGGPSTIRLGDRVYLCTPPALPSQ